MAELKTVVLERLALFISELNPKKLATAPTKLKLTTEERIATLNMLRTDFPDLLSNLGLPEEVIKDNNLLSRYLSNDRYRNKFIDGVLRRLTSVQNNELTKLTRALETQPVAAEGIGGQIVAGEQAGTMQGSSETSGSLSAVPMGGFPAVPSFTSPAGRVVYQAPPKTPKPDIAIANKSGVVIEKPNPEAKLVTSTGSPIVKEPIPKSSLILPGKDYKPPSEFIITNKSGVPVSTLKFQSGWRSTLKTGFSNGLISLRQNGGRILNGLRGMVGSTTDGMIRGGGNQIARILNGGIPGRGAISGGVSRARTITGSARSTLEKAGNKRWLLALLGFILFGALVGVIVPSSNPTGQPVSTSQLTGIPDNQIVTVVGNIGNCQFIRSDQNPKAAIYQSSIIMSYFQEASNKSGIPVTVLAAFTRVESPSLAYKTNNDLDSLECAVSDTGALGIMQLQPKGTKGHDEKAIAQGALFIGKQYNELTREDYCNPQKNILMGAGFILKKMSYFGYGDGARWDQSWTTNKQAIYALVEGYYGCLKYGAKADVEKGEKQVDIRCDDPRHKYNYGDDVWNSIQNCQVVAAACPVAGGVISTPSYQEGQQSGKNNGHCSPGYLKDGNKCREDCEGGIGQSRRAKAIDVPTNGKYVQLPTVNGEKIKWTLMAKPYEVTEEDGEGYGYTFVTSQGGDNYYLDMLHLNASSMQAGVGYDAGDPITTAFKDHVHMTIGKNIKSTESPGSKSFDCDSGWLPSDFMCK